LLQLFCIYNMCYMYCYVALLLLLLLLLLYAYVKFVGYDVSQRHHVQGC